MIEVTNFIGFNKPIGNKLLSTKSIPHFCPQGKKLYFKRSELDDWLQRKRQSSTDEIDAMATEYILKNKRK